MRYFADVARLNQRRSGYAAFPWVLRGILWVFSSPRTWQVLSYLMLRMGRESIVWVTDQQMAKDIGVTPRKVGPHLKRLVELGFISMRTIEGQRYVAIVDPFHAIQQLVNAGIIVGDRLDDLNEDLAAMKLPAFEQDGTLPTDTTATNTTAGKAVAADG